MLGTTSQTDTVADADPRCNPDAQGCQQPLQTVRIKGCVDGSISLLIC
jgi:hypothetical protein